ncbi:MAG TPA: peptide chain release factor N(5)-glutamine methyltransferase [Chitinophagales bacterium]|nr:peptide chain release factor N(5)-glutamine methyltransferase [Chitinophagales bacterium]
MLKEVEKEFSKRLSHLYDLQEIKEIFLLCAEEILALSRTEIILQKDRDLGDDVRFRFEALLSSLEKGVPIQYALGYAWFYGMKLKVNEGVLIPRPETEELVALILKENRHKNPKIIDIGTGSGCIPIALKKHLPEAEVWGLDVSPEALKVASENAKNENCAINFVEADILHADKVFPQHNFDIIVSNPPYITPSEKSAMAANVLDHEPHLALFIPEENPLLFYEVIAGFAKERLCKGGKLYFEINRRFSQELKVHLVKLGFTEVEVHLDMHGADRMVSAVNS